MGHHGKYCIYSSSWDYSALTPNNRLVLPERQLFGACEWVLTFMAAGTGTDCTERFTVNISTDGAIYTQIGNAYTTNEWQEITIDLSDYVGKYVTIAIDHKDCTNQFVLRLDCFNLWAKQVHSAEGHPFLSFFDDFESDVMLTYYLADTNTWHAAKNTTSRLLLLTVFTRRRRIKYFGGKLSYKI